MPPEKIIFRTRNGAIECVPDANKLRVEARHWAHVVGARGRWVRSPRLDLEKRAHQTLLGLGLAPEQIEELAWVPVIEVCLELNSGGAALSMPWEYVLTTATHAKRRHRSVVVVRHLANSSRNGVLQEAPGRTLIVDAAPGGLAEFYGFEDERRLVRTNLAPRVKDKKKHVIYIESNPTAEALKSQIAKIQPHVIHLSAVDIQQAGELLKHDMQDYREGEEDDADSPAEGVILRHNQRDYDAVTAKRLAGILNAGRRRPALVALNFYNSSSQIATQILAGGTRAAIGFQDHIDDALAELFFANFYRAWRRSNWSLLPAFKFAWERLRKQSAKIYGTGVILWSTRSLIADAAKDSDLERFERQLLAEDQAPIRTYGKTATDLRKMLAVSVWPKNRLNYALLHNGRPLFDRFRLTKFTPGVLNSVDIRVTLHTGEHSFPYQRSLALTDQVENVGDAVRVPMTSELGRSVTENIQSSMLVEVSAGDHSIYRETHSVTLLPIDEWKDNEQEGHWLPSFVLPRDPAVHEIIDSAQSYLMALSDRASAGFDGYQSKNVHRQVRAIWYALAYEPGLSYVSPPPSFSEHSQRLRSPSEIMEKRRGTCIDLALLFAACLEFVDIYPVIFLTSGHAFAGYWKSREAYAEFLNVLSRPPRSVEQGNEAAHESEVKYPWRVPKDFHHEITELAKPAGGLVALETQLITRSGRFKDAVDRGRGALAASEKFDSIIDVKLARDYPVTPLPLSWRRA